MRGGAVCLRALFRRAILSVAHVEVDNAACNTLKTRVAYHWLKNNDKLSIYYEYLNQKFTRKQLYESIPDSEIASVINSEIGKQTLTSIFKKVDDNLNGRKLDLIIGGPPCQAYSMVGRARDKKRMKGDKRNYLYIYYAEFLRKYKPRYFVFENVTGLLSAKSLDGNLYLERNGKIVPEEWL